jgi:hypothetical protein
MKTIGDPVAPCHVPCHCHTFFRGCIHWGEGMGKGLKRKRNKEERSRKNGRVKYML